MPTYEHLCKECNHEWEQAYGMTESVPDTCPECNTKGKVQRLIAWCAGTVVLTGRENVAKQWQEGKRMAREAKKKGDENFAANIVGEDKFHQNQSAIDKIKKDI
ncbi:MAG TPA: zinc ribbon domain-containing protein [Flavobacteriaceae bacterium]|nr:zinc ribbon domain-containing protein [Flavobacteriaceae bacterium]